MMIALRERDSIHYLDADAFICVCVWWYANREEKEEDEKKTNETNSKYKNCKSGLVHNYQAMKMIAAFGPLITGLFKYAFMTNVVLQDFLFV